MAAGIRLDAPQHHYAGRRRCGRQHGGEAVDGSGDRPVFERDQEGTPSTRGALLEHDTIGTN
jgi:hypothetical protein